MKVVQPLAYCGECGCPATEHDMLGICHALDAPFVGLVGNCSCDGFSGAPLR